MTQKDSRKKYGYNWLPDFVYGGIDGSVTTFAVVAGVQGASLSIPVILILGFANLFADGFSMASGKYLSDKSAQEQYKNLRQIEFERLTRQPEKELAGVRTILKHYGFKGEDLKKAIAVVTQDKDKWADMLMMHEFNMNQESVNPLKGALATFSAFLMIGIIPLLAYLFKAFLPLTPNGLFALTCVATFLAMFIVGAVKSRFVTKSWFASGLEIAGMGSLAATISYLIGFLLKGLVG
ncbi:VIT1/CCC1 transporter family protein [Candidatus Peregrinibacteria bacterium]|nr:MAG: VIT1/CCC1 transporter family protein [Candidatus Peregrinibacteria bacterium]